MGEQTPHPGSLSAATTVYARVTSPAAAARGDRERRPGGGAGQVGSPAPQRLGPCRSVGSGHFPVSRFPFLSAPRRAFSLVELLAAIVVLALLTAGAAWTFGGPLRRAQLGEAVEQVRSFDATGRQFARNAGRECTLALDLDDGVLTRIEAGGRETFRAVVARPCRIDEVRTARRRYDGGQAVVAVSGLGLSESYAVKMSAGGDVRWVVFAGLSGESRAVSDEAMVDEILGRGSIAGVR